MIWMATKTHLEADWVSDDDGSGDTPPSLIESSSSFVWNLNYHANPASEWDVTLGGARTSDNEWRSPRFIR